MMPVQTVNQIVFIIAGLVLASLFASTYSTGSSHRDDTTRRYWLLSVGTRTASLLCVPLVPYVGPAIAVIGNMLFLFSAGCLALLFRSWRIPIDSAKLRSVLLFTLAAGIAIEVLRHVNPSFGLRIVLLGSCSIAISGWELAELARKIKSRPNGLLKIIAAVVVLQMLLSIASVATSAIYAYDRVGFAVDNDTRSAYAIWATLGAHLVIYFFIGGYLYRRALQRELDAVRKKNDVSALLDERERLLASLIASNRVASTGALSASVAHEMSQPLTATMLKLALLRRALEKEPADASARMTLLQEALDNLVRANDVLDSLRSLFRQTPARLRRCNLDTLVAQTIALVRNRIDSRDIALSYSPSGGLHAELVEREIQQVLINLINNAADSLKNCDSTDRRIEIVVTGLPDMARIVVADNGPGIQPELSDTLFELARSSKPDGMGIGLWISKYIVEDHHRGRLYVDPGHAPGARFAIEIPLRQAEAETAGPAGGMHRQPA